MNRLAVIPSDPIEEYLKGGYSKDWLTHYYNPCRYFDEVYLLSPLEKDNDDLLGMKAVHTPEKEFKNRLKELRIDLVRAYGGNWACRFVCERKVPGIPVVVSVHDMTPAMIYDSIRKADVVFCVSQAVRELVLQKFSDPQRTWLLPNRVDRDIMRPYAFEDTQDLDRMFPYPCRILYVGRLVAEKNLDTLLKTLPLLGEKYCLIAVGSGEQEHYRAMARIHNVAERVFFKEVISHAELARYYSWATCMCTPSRSEGFGMVFVEALACQAVVVTSNIAPINEFIVHGHNGLLVDDYEDPQALAEGIRRACTDRVLREKFKNNARESVRLFDKTLIDRQEAGYYDKVLDMKERKAFDAPFWRQALNKMGLKF